MSTILPIPLKTEFAGTNGFRIPHNFQTEFCPLNERFRDLCNMVHGHVVEGLKDKALNVAERVQPMVYLVWLRFE